MTIKQQVLKALVKNMGKSVSGEQLSKELFCSRNAVWKAIKSLENDGYEIEATTNKGYCLKNENVTFSSVLVEKYLKTDCKVIVLDDIDSTNNYLKKLAEDGEKENTVVIAKHQSGGKGRMGRSFFSPKSGLYMSILLRPNFSAEKSLFITTATAVAVSDAIDSLSDKSSSIKWVNDVFIDSKKVCGILTEASIDFETGGLSYAVVGLGVNLYHPADGFPEDIKNIAGTVFDSEISGDEKAKFAAEIINGFFNIYNNFENSDFMKRYKSKSFILGKKINVIKGDKKIPATAIDIDDEARLLVEYETGERESLFSGEVSIKL